MLTQRFLRYCNRPFNFLSSYITLSKQSYSSLDPEAFEDSINKTTIELTSRTPDMHQLLLTGYGPGVFQFVNTRIHGSVAIVDKAVFRWNIDDPQDITKASLAMFHMIFPKLDIVVIGTGNKFYPLPPDVINDMQSVGVAVEVQDTRHACGTYNLLKKERPELVGAALIPIIEKIPVNKMIHKGGRPAIDR